MRFGMGLPGAVDTDSYSKGRSRNRPRPLPRRWLDGRLGGTFNEETQMEAWYEVAARCGCGTVAPTSAQSSVTLHGLLGTGMT